MINWKTFHSRDGNEMIANMENDQNFAENIIKKIVWSPVHFVIYGPDSWCFLSSQRLLARPGMPGIPVCLFWKATSVFKLCFILGSTKYTATYICSRKTSELIFNRTLHQKLKEEAYFFCLIMSHSTSNCCPLIIRARILTLVYFFFHRFFVISDTNQLP